MSEFAIKPLITVIVPVYNGERWIRKCLNSLVYQTLQNIEIIAVDNGSTDQTRMIMDEYAHQFPQKVSVATIEHTNGPGGGRNYGLNNSHADYIIFADVDDYFDFKAFEILYDKAISENYDMVICASYDVKGKSIKKTRELKSTNKEYVLQYGSMVFWNKLVKKDLFDLAGPVPEHIVFEDIAYVSTLISYSTKIGYVDQPLYYYILRDDSGVNDLSSDRLLHSLEAYKIALQNCKSSEKKPLIASIAHRICYDLEVARWTFADKYIEFIKENRNIFEDNDLIEKDKPTFATLAKIYNLDENPIPQRVYINGFNNNISLNLMDQIYEKAFYKKTELIRLDEDRCDINILPIIKKAYEEGNYEFVAEYFALANIVESGGVYISNNIEILNTFNCLKYCGAFIGYLDSKNFTSEVFGGKSNNNFYKRLLSSYCWKGLYQQISFSLADRIKNILMVEYQCNMDGKDKVVSEDIFIFGPQVFVTDIAGRYHICKHNFSHQNLDSDYVTLKKSTFEQLLSEKEK